MLFWGTYRFDIDEDMETQLNFVSAEHTQMASTFTPSPPPQDEPQRGQQPGNNSTQLVACPET